MMNKNKPRWSLLPMDALGLVAACLTKGAKKHPVLGYVDAPHNLYIDALYRHMAAYLCGEEYDEDSGFPHLAMAASNCLILLAQFLRSAPGELDPFGK